MATTMHTLVDNGYLRSIDDSDGSWMTAAITGGMNSDVLEGVYEIGWYQVTERILCQKRFAILPLHSYLYGCAGINVRARQ